MYKINIVEIYMNRMIKIDYIIISSRILFVRVLLPVFTPKKKSANATFSFFLLPTYERGKLRVILTVLRAADVSATATIFKTLPVYTGSILISSS